MLTNRERMLAVYANRLPDRIPVGIYSRYHRVGEAERVARNAGLGILDFFPAVSLLAPPWHIQTGYLSEVRNTDFDVAYRWEDGRLIQRRRFRTPVGTVEAQVFLDPDSASEWTRKHYIETPEDYKIVQYIVENTVFHPQQGTVEQRITDLGEDGVLLGRMDRSPYQKLLVELADPEKLILDICTDPGPVEELMQVIDRRLDEQFAVMLESSVSIVWQPDNVTADMTPPDYFQKYNLPFYTKHGTQCRAAGKIYAVHIDGRTKGIKDLIAEAPIDVVESFSLPEMAGDLSLEEARAAWPGKVICPNFPANLCAKSADEIELYLTNLFRDHGGRTPFMIQISEDIPLETYPHVVRVLSEFTRKETLR